MTKKIVRLTESDLERIVRRVIKESMGVGFMSGEPNGLKIKKMETKSWKEIKDTVYGVKGTERRDELERDFGGFKIGLQLKKAREEKHLTQAQLAERIEKKREYISRIENNGSNLTLKTLYDIVEKGFGGKVKIEIEI